MKSSLVTWKYSVINKSSYPLTAGLRFPPKLATIDLDGGALSDGGGAEIATLSYKDKNIRDTILRDLKLILPHDP